MTENNGNQVTCKNCGNEFTGRFCNICGEKLYNRHDNTMWHLIEESAHFITHFEGTFFNTLRVLLTRPGKLSNDYCAGIRKKYFKPISFFLLLVVLYLLFPFFEGLNQRLGFYMSNRLYGNYVTKWVHHTLQQTGLSMQELSNHFHEKGEKASKFLLLLLIPFSALILQLLTFKKRRLFYDHVIFATEINIIYLLWGFLLLPLIIVSWSYIIQLFNGHRIVAGEMIVVILVFTMCVVYTVIAARKFYALSWLQAVVLSIFYTVLFAACVMYVYKFILFWIVSMQIH